MKFNEADRITRRKALSWFRRVVSKWPSGRVIEVIDRVTGGLGYRSQGRWDIVRMGYVGSLISWAERVREGYRVFEIGTGIGRTCYTVVGFVEVDLYLTVDASIDMLAIALYRNPIEQYRSALNKPPVKVVWIDAVKAARVLPGEYFDHVVHDGGPNPGRNPRLYSIEFLRELYRILKPGGGISIFAGRNPAWVDRIYEGARMLGFRHVETVSFPDSPVRVLHMEKP